MTDDLRGPSRLTVGCVALGLLAILVFQLVYASRANSVTWDEGHHLFDGYNILTQHDYGLNPEVPPLVKMVAAIPLLRMPLYVPPLQGRAEQTEAFLDGKDFLFRNDANTVLFRARMACALFMVGLAVGVLVAGWEMFGAVAGLIGLALLVFDPNFLAHGALVTTDAAISCCVFWALYLAYRYAKRPSVWRLVLVGLVSGLAMVTKFTGLLVLPCLLVLVVAELLSARDWKLFGRRVVALLVVSAIALGVIWSFYGFRYSARPAGRVLHPVLAVYLTQVPSAADARHLGMMARWHVLPEAYIYGLANTKITEFADTSYFFGRVYRHGIWPYFPAAIAIKSTLPFLLLMAAVLVLLVSRRMKLRREIVFLGVLPVVYLAVAMHSTMDIGFRHVLPIYGFLYVLGAGAAVCLVRLNWRWSFGVGALLVWQMVTCVRVAPAYMAYGNEAWGGPGAVHKYLSDANDDWGQQLNAVRRYLDGRGVKNCWFAYFPDVVVDMTYYGVPCKRLPTQETLYWIKLPMDVPPEIDGPVLISDSDLEGIELGEGKLNPYEEFRHIRPTALIDGGVWVFDGHFKVPLASALVETRKAQGLLADGDAAAALPVAEGAVALAPESEGVQETMGDVLVKLGRMQEARVHYEAALKSSETIEPALQADAVSGLKAKVLGVGGD
jgi:hypothetical protein